jgi:hypothetical protein
MKRGILKLKQKPWIIRLLLILFAPRFISSQSYFLLEGIPIGWIIVAIALIVKLI